MAANQFQARWNKLFADKSTGSVDLVASFGEDFLNAFLQAHYHKNEDKYKIRIERDFNDHNTPRKFRLDLTIESPGLHIFLPPFPARVSKDSLDGEFSDRSGWIQPVFRVEDRARARAEAAPPPNVRLVGKMGVQFRWPKLSAPNESWVFPESGPLILNCLIEANCALETIAVEHDSTNSRQVLRLSVTQIKFDKASEQAARTAWKRLVAEVGKELEGTPDDQKFLDLLVIAMNVAATEYAPQIVKNLPLPTPVLHKRKLFPALFDLGEKLATIGFSLDLPSYIADVTQAVSKKAQRFDALLQEDLEKLGGLEGLVRAQKQGRKGAALFPRSAAFLQQIRQPTAKVKSRQRAAAAPNLALAVDEYLLHALASDALPHPKQGNTDWLSLGLVRGRLDWWLRFFDAQVSVHQPANVEGSVHIDVGGAVEACVRKFWDCSWKWDCGKLSLAVVGAPAVELSLEQGSSGINFKAKLKGRVTFGSNLPWPFGDVVEALGDVVWWAVKGFIDIILDEITFQIVPPEIELKDLNLTIRLSEFAPSYYERADIWQPTENHPSSRRRFISCDALGTPS